MRTKLVKTVGLLVFSFLFQNVFAKDDKNEITQEWVDITDVFVRQDEMIVSSMYYGKGELATPAVTLLEVENGMIAVMMSLNSAKLFEREKELNSQYRIMYVTNNNERVSARNYGESIGAPSGQWISSFIYLPSYNLLKKDTLKVIIQGLATPERLKAINKQVNISNNLIDSNEITKEHEKLIKLND